MRWRPPSYSPEQLALFTVLLLCLGRTDAGILSRKDFSEESVDVNAIDASIPLIGDTVARFLPDTAPRPAKLSHKQAVSTMRLN